MEIIMLSTRNNGEQRAQTWSVDLEVELVLQDASNLDISHNYHQYFPGLYCPQMPRLMIFGKFHV